MARKRGVRGTRRPKRCWPRAIVGLCGWVYRAGIVCGFSRATKRATGERMAGGKRGWIRPVILRSWGRFYHGWSDARPPSRFHDAHISSSRHMRDGPVVVESAGMSMRAYPPRSQRSLAASVVGERAQLTRTSSIFFISAQQHKYHF